MSGYDGLAFCAHQDTQLGGELIKWPLAEISWGVIDYLPGLSHEAYARCIADCFANWAKVCGIRPRQAEVGERPNIAFTLQTERPGGVLADCQLPVQATRSTQLICRVDQADKWCVASGLLPPTHPLIDAGRTLTHELGHGLGISHLAAGNLMAPTYSVRVWLPQAGDIVEAQARYGPPLPDVPTASQAGADDWQAVASILRKGSDVKIRAVDGREFTL